MQCSPVCVSLCHSILLSLICPFIMLTHTCLKYAKSTYFGMNKISSNVPDFGEIFNMRTLFGKYLKKKMQTNIKEKLSFKHFSSGSISLGFIAPIETIWLELMNGLIIPLTKWLVDWAESCTKKCLSHFHYIDCDFLHLNIITEIKRAFQQNETVWW